MTLKELSKMLSISRNFLSLLLLGHLIAGVNRQVDSFGTQDLPTNEVLSRKATKLLDFQNDISQSNKHISINEDLQEKQNIGYSPCPQFDSCSGRCGEQNRDFPYLCNCDSFCKQFSDCCFDYEQQCKLATNDKFYSHIQYYPRMTCEILFMKFNLLAVSACPNSYGNALTKTLCSSTISKDCSFGDDFNVSDAATVFSKCYTSDYRSCFSKAKSKCKVSEDPQCPIATKKTCSKRAHNQCKKCDTSFWPVAGQNGILYRNSFCALCNYEKRYTTLSPYILKKIAKETDDFKSRTGNMNLNARPCVPTTIDSCPKSFRDRQVQQLCQNYSGAVLANGKKRMTYKNRHCAMCNGEKVTDLECATKQSIMKSLIGPLLVTFIRDADQGTQFDDIPAAFSILLNFGLDGRERMYFSSEKDEEMKQNQERCGEGKIWDPFSEICRTLYCSTEFVLVDYRCVKKEITDEKYISNNETIIPDARAEYVHLTLTAEVEMLDFLQFNGQDIDAICEDIRKSLANSLDINIDRIRDVRFNISLGNFTDMNDTLRFIEEMNDLHPIEFKIDFDLYEEYAVNVNTSEPSVDSIVSKLAYSLSMNGFEFDVNNVTSRIFQIHQRVSPLTTWCNPASGGRRREYWNSEFSLVTNEENSTMMDNQIKGIYVKNTGKFYTKGTFIADILFQGYQFSGSLINVSGLAVVCDRKRKLNESCIRILIHEEEYMISENGSLSIHNASLRNVIDYFTYEMAENNSIWVCLKSLKTVGSFKRYRLEMNVEEALVSFVLLLISIIALAIVLLTYMIFESLRNLPGCNTMNLTFSLMAMQITFIIGQRGNVKGKTCVFVGHLLHYQLLCCFMWMNVMAFDLFRTFGNRNVLSNIRSKTKYLPMYFAYAYLSPLIIITITSLLDYFLYESPFAPNYGANNICWITNPNAAITFFAAPLAVIMIVNFVFSLLTILAMRSVKSLSHIKEQQTNRRGKSDLFLYARMALVIGLTWALSFAAAFANPADLAGKILTYLFTIFNTLQGVFIFWVFICNKRVYDLYKEAFRNFSRKFYRSAKYETSSGTLSRLNYAMARSISNNTVVSTLSNASASSNDSQIPATPE